MKTSFFKTPWHLCVLLLLLVVIGCGCNGTNEERKGEEAIEQKANTTSTSKDSFETESVPMPQTAVVYFDASTSMKGYISAEKEDRFNGYIASISNFVSDTKIYMHDTAAQHIAFSVSDFMKKLNDKNITYSDESDIWAMIKSLANSRADVAFLVTDGIMSGSNAQIKKNPNYNIDFREAMKESIANLVKQTSKSILIIRLTTNFSGTYYTYCNGKVTLNNKPRPFFILCMGEQKYVKYIEQQFMKKYPITDITHPHDVLILGEDLSSRLTFGPNDGLQHSKSKAEEDKTSWVMSKEGFKLSANISQLPLYMQNETYFQKNLTFTAKDKKQNQVMVDGSKYTVSISEIGNEKKVVLSFSRLGILSLGGTLEWKLVYKLPDWVMVQSSSDDHTISNSNTSECNKTFNLSYFIDGLKGVNSSDYVATGLIHFAKN